MLQDRLHAGQFAGNEPVVFESREAFEREHPKGGTRRCATQSSAERLSVRHDPRSAWRLESIGFENWVTCVRAVLRWRVGLQIG